MLTGISTLVDLDIPFPQLLEQIAAAGFDCFSLSHSVEHAGYHTAAGRAEIRRLMAQMGLTLDYIHPPIQAYFDLTSLDEQVRRLTLEMLSFNARVCAELKGRCLTVHACNEKYFPAEELEARVEAGLRSLEHIAPLAAREGVMLCVENLPATLDAQTVTLELLRRCQLPELYITLDPNHAWISSPDPLALVRELAPRARATHISDTLGEHDSHLLPGAGVVDNMAVADILATAGFCAARGDVVDLECSVMMQRRRIASGKLHPGDPGYGDTPAGSPPTTDEYLMLAHAAAVKIATRIEAKREAA